MENPLATLSLDGGWLCLDFINTVSPRQPTGGTEYLRDWNDFVWWVQRVGLFSETEFDVWQKMPPGVMAEVWALREGLYEIFRYVAAHQTVHPDHLELLNGFLHETYAHTCLRHTPAGIRRDVDPAPHPEKPLWLIVLSAENLVLSDRLPRVKACDNCGWLFLDTSKNGTRRWCNMLTCGSQTKAKAYYHRKKSASAPPE